MKKLLILFTIGLLSVGCGYISDKTSKNGDDDKPAPHGNNNDADENASSSNKKDSKGKKETKKDSKGKKKDKEYDYDDNGDDDDKQDPDQGDPKRQCGNAVWNKRLAYVGTSYFYHVWLESANSYQWQKPILKIASDSGDMGGRSSLKGGKIVDPEKCKNVRNYFTGFAAFWEGEEIGYNFGKTLKKGDVIEYQPSIELEFDTSKLIDSHWGFTSNQKKIAIKNALFTPYILVGAHGIVISEKDKYPMELNCNKPFRVKYEWSVKDDAKAKDNPLCTRKIGTENEYKCVVAKPVSTGDECTFSVKNVDFPDNKGKTTRASIAGTIKMKDGTGTKKFVYDFEISQIQFSN